ncbi:MAG: putative histidine kinase, atypical unorthodox [Ramlibacter sp.]|jgi:CheY-like chemotaxis protein/signal transduction histidine kinase|nr:putative histidine kinase, atypical unorthodox [Ramlibacter sp.]
MTAFLARLYQHYKDYHAYGPPRLKYMGYVGVISLSLLYFIRFTRPNPQPFEDIVPRALAIGMLALLALKDHWPERFKPYYIGYSYAVLVYCLPCFTVLVGLQRGGGMPSVSNSFILLCFLVLLTDWRNTIVMLVSGVALATLIYVATTPDPRVPMDMVAQLPAYALIVIGGNLFKFSTEQIDAERKLRATQALAGSIAHELRHPLAQLKHSLEGMQEVLPAPGASRRTATLDAQQVQALYGHVARGEQAVERGLQIISMTLDEVSARPIDSSTFRYLSAAEVVQQAVEEYSYESDAERDKVGVKVVEDFTFKGDETAYLFVLFNLVKNALYYVKLHPDTRVSIAVGDHQVKVRDNGPGIAPDTLAGLFEPFRSVGKSGGTGLGLAYCQRVMRAFGGEITCASTVGEFTEFTMRFPAISDQESEQHRLLAIAQARTALAGRRILIVEDDPIQRMATRQKLGPLAMTSELDEAEDGRQALEMLGERDYDVLLLDLNMPGVDGYAVTEKVRASSGSNRNVRIVAYTSEPAHLARRKALRSGMDSFVGKPCSQLPLLAALQNALQQGASPRDALGRLAGRRILLADDSAFNRKAIAAYLRNAAAMVIEVEHGAAVLEQLYAQDGIDAVIVDLQMPGMDGLETTRAIRGSREAWAGVPVIALTARSDEPAVAAATAAGMNAFLVKPVDAPLLYDTIAKLLAGGHAMHSVTTQPALPPELPPAAADALLNLLRLESYRRLGMLDELLNDYVPEMARLVGTLGDAAVAGDRNASMDALHSLLGMSGEAGAQVLYQQVRRIYVPLLEEGRWPEGSDWLPNLQDLAGRTEHALRAYCGSESRAA